MFLVPYENSNLVLTKWHEKLILQNLYGYLN